MSLLFFPGQSKGTEQDIVPRHKKARRRKRGGGHQVAPISNEDTSRNRVVVYARDGLARKKSASATMLFVSQTHNAQLVQNVHTLKCDLKNVTRSYTWSKHQVHRLVWDKNYKARFLSLLLSVEKSCCNLIELYVWDRWLQWIQQYKCYEDLKRRSSSAIANVFRASFARKLLEKRRLEIMVEQERLRQEILNDQHKRVRAVILIQSYSRASDARKFLLKFRRDRMECISALSIQLFWRSCIARRQVHHLKKKMSIMAQAATCIQSRGRVLICRRFRMLLLTKEKVENRLRSDLEARMSRFMRRLTIGSSIRIQRWLKRILVARLYIHYAKYLLYLKKLGAIVMCQSYLRVWFALRKLETLKCEKKLRFKAALEIQCFARKSLARNEYSQMQWENEKLILSNQIVKQYMLTRTANHSKSNFYVSNYYYSVFLCMQFISFQLILSYDRQEHP